MRKNSERIKTMATTLKIKLILATLLTPLILISCASGPLALDMWVDVAGGRHNEVTGTFEKEVGEFDNWIKVGVEGGINGHPYFQRLMIETCRAYHAQRKFNKAKVCLASFDRLFEKRLHIKSLGYSKDEIDYRRSYNRAHYHALEGELSLELGDFQLAYEASKRAIDVNTQNTVATAPTHIDFRAMTRLYANAAIAAYQVGKNKEAHEIASTLENSGHDFWSDAKEGINLKIRNTQLARVYMVMGEYKLAKEALNKSTGSLAMFDRILFGVLSLGVNELIGAGQATTDPFVAQHFFLHTKLCFELGDYECAKKGYDVINEGDFKKHANAIERINPTGFVLQRPTVSYIALHDRGTIAKKQEDNLKALRYYERAIKVIESQRATISTEVSKIGFVGNKEDVYRDTVSLLIKMKQYGKAFVYAERAKARALVDTLASKQTLGNVNSKSKATLLMAKLSTTERKIDQSGSAVGSKQRSANRGLLLKTKSSLISTQPELASLVTVSAPDLSELQGLLPKNETLIEYYGDNNNLYAFVLNKRGVEAVKIKASNISAQVTAFRKALTNPKNENYKRAARNLYMQLIAPLKPHLTTRSITIVPHGALHYLPFNALMVNDKFMLDKYDIRLLPSASVMKFLNKKTKAPYELLALGNPDTGDRSLDLPGAQKEAQAIVKGFRRAKLLIRGNATETAVKTSGGKYKRLHFASHGIFDAEKPLTSGLLLTKDSSNDGVLTVGELYDLNLNADLVTLSACETALGKVANGDDVVGFTRGFLYAGAKSIVSSLWKVDDAATSQLMQSFYGNLKKMDKRSALRAAQLNTKKKYTHPYYWAAFQLTGSVN